MAVGTFLIPGKPKTADPLLGMDFRPWLFE
jgi:hypothetical protein